MSREEWGRIGTVLSEVLGGDHHVQWHRLKRESPTQATYTVIEGWATFDGDELTRLVLAAHAHAVRVEIGCGGPFRIKLRLSERVREGESWKRHPTLALHLSRLAVFAERDAVTTEGAVRPGVTRDGEPR